VHALVLGASLKIQGLACPRGYKRVCATLTGQSGRRLGHEENDKQKGWGCANGLAWVRGGVRRDVMSGDGRSARGEDAQGRPAMCPSNRRPSGRGREQPIKTRPGRKLAWEGLSILREG
jgi:hypothetical protein